MAAAGAGLNAVDCTLDLLLEPADNPRLARLCGPLNAHLRQLEARLGIEIRHRGHDFRLIGARAAVAAGDALLRDLYRQAGSGELSGDRLNRCLQEAAAAPPAAEAPPPVELALQHARLRAHGAHQREYLAALQARDLVFSIGPAGTGKTHLAVARAVQALERGEVRRVVLVRPVVEAGERLGFLPGDLVQKIDPYLRPMHDALDELLGRERVARRMAAGDIEVAPLAYMRGRTLRDAYAILDEAQNATRGQMKMFLTRLGFGARAAVTGDLSQTDLPEGRCSGLEEAVALLEGAPGIAVVRFDRRDVLRHPLVQQVLAAYERGR